MNSLLAVALIVGMIVIAGLIIAGIGLLAQSKIKKQAPVSRILAKFTPTGLAFAACYTFTLLVGVAVRTLTPNGVLGSFLNSSWGIIAAVVIVIVGFSVIEAALAKLGFPITKKAENDDT